MYEFRRTDGFYDYWEKYYPIAQKNTEHRLYECVHEKVEQLFLLLDKEYFELGEHEIYGKLCEYVSDKIYATFDGKLSYGYRFEALADGNPTTDEDYDKAMKGIKEIIDMF